MANQLQYKPLDNVGMNGLNIQANPASLDPSWLTRADNIILRESGRISFRKGLKQNVLKTTAKIGSLIEHKDGSTNKTFAGVGTFVYTVDFTTPDEPWTGPFTAGTASDWQFVNFNNSCYGFQTANPPIKYASSTWSVTTNKPSVITVFDPSCAMGYYGRMWVGGISEEKDVVYYSDTLNPDIWYNTTSLAAIEPSINYTILSVNDSPVSSLTTGIGYKITKLKELDAISDTNKYKVVSDNRALEGANITIGLYYEIVFTEENKNWSSVGGPSSANIGDIFQCDTATDISTLGEVVISWQNLGGDKDTAVNTTFVATTSDADISEYGVVQLNDWSSFGGSSEVSLGDLFTATLTQSIADYGEVELDWRVLGGPEIANVNDTFISDSSLASSTDISLYGTVHTSYGAAGFIDLKSVWGTDTIVAIQPFYGKLIIFGKHNIVIYNGPADPNAMALDEVIRGIGCASRDSIQSVGDDLYFLSNTGVRSLSRTTEKDNIPLQDLSLTIKDTIIRNTSQSANAKAIYVESEGTYILSFIDLNITYVFDIKHETPAGTPRITTWSFDDDREPSSFAYTESKDLLIGQSVGSIATYEGYYDKDYISGGSYTSASYTGTFKTTWIDLGQGAVASLLKKLKAVISGGSGTTIGIKWYKDFNTTPSKTTNFLLNPGSTGTLALFGASTSLYGASKYTPIFGMKEYNAPLTGSAKHLQIEMSGETAGFTSSLQDITLLYKQGKIR